MPERKRFLLRLDPGVHAALERWAGDELRSVNAQIEYALLDALRRAGRLPAQRRGPPVEHFEDFEDVENTPSG